MLTAIVISPRPKVTHSAMTCRLDSVRVASTGNGRAKTMSYIVNYSQASCKGERGTILNTSEDRFKAKLALKSL
jgi:hypothetical protein